MISQIPERLHPELVEGSQPGRYLFLYTRPKIRTFGPSGAIPDKTLEIGEVAEWSKAAVSKTVIPFGYLGFESLPLRIAVQWPWAFGFRN